MNSETYDALKEYDDSIDYMDIALKILTNAESDPRRKAKEAFS